ncbi:Putative inner membrane exporter, YdcZ [Micromonospora rhizosphaerae]|uniref:Putative inner membrane exporter, YdcZ n=1 Tax=Micromonospora rhizosphaerae TaxID=568872 RepID=A0A1C6RPP3_9ACTN|nr:Putative inner membrane exporter, YdcZ [Micromonospora rhizosphaerae]
MSATGIAAPPTLPTARRIAGIGLATVSGVAVAVQSRINGELGVRLADGIAAAVVSFGLGLLLLLVLLPATPGGQGGRPPAGGAGKRVATPVSVLRRGLGAGPRWSPRGRRPAGSA